MQDPRQHRGAAEAPQLWEVDGPLDIPQITRPPRPRLRTVDAAAASEKPIPHEPRHSPVTPVQGKRQELVLLLSVEEAARALGIGRSKTYELIAAGDLETVHIGRAVRVPLDAVESFVQRLRRPRGPLG